MLYQDLSHKILDSAMKVHSNLGPGLFEEVYKVCLRHELTKSGIKVLSEVGLPVIYDSVELDIGYRIDLLVIINKIYGTRYSCLILLGI